MAEIWIEMEVITFGAIHMYLDLVCFPVNQESLITFCVHDEAK